MIAFSHRSTSLAVTLGLAMLAGCTTSPNATTLTLGRQAATTPASQTTTAKATTSTAAAAAQTAPFAVESTTAKVTPATVVTSETDARAVATNDEKLIEGISAALEANELDASVGYSVAAVAEPLPTVRTVLGARQAKAPVRQPQWGQQEKAQLEDRRQRTLAARETFERSHPEYASEADAVREVVEQAPWRANPEDDSTVCRQGGSTQKTAQGGTRKVAMTRVVGKARPHFLIQSRIEIEETSGGATKTITWEKTLQADGSSHVVFHHEYTSPDGKLWVTDWEKTLTIDGRLSGAGSFQQCDRHGRRLKQDRLVIGGNDRDGQKVVCIPEASPQPTPSPSPSPSPEVSESPEALPSVEVSASPSPVASEYVVCRTGAVTGGGRLADTNYSFGFGPQVVTINDVSGSGAEWKADVADVIYDGNTATLTARLRAPETGTITLVVTDNGEGANDPDDTITFLTGATVTASGPVTRGQPGGGNVQVRNDCE